MGQHIRALSKNVCPHMPQYFCVSYSLSRIACLAFPPDSLLDDGRGFSFSRRAQPHHPSGEVINWLHIDFISCIRALYTISLSSTTLICSPAESQVPLFTVITGTFRPGQCVVPRHSQVINLSDSSPYFAAESGRR
jgi:hypothetical protein